VEPSEHDSRSDRPPADEQALQTDADRVRRAFTEAVDGAQRGHELAGTLCTACVDLLIVDGASLSVVQDGTVGGSVGSSNALSRELEELQFTCGEGPSVDVGAAGVAVLVSDLEHGGVQRWPAFAPAAIQRGVRGIFALPVSIGSVHIGVLGLYRSRATALDARTIAGGLLAAELAALPVLDLMSGDLDAALTEPTSAAYRELTMLTRVEVYQATGMLIAQLNVGPAEALVRLRGYAFAQNRTVNDVAWDIVERRLRLESDQHWHNQQKDEPS
jgi:ANTAR domain